MNGYTDTSVGMQWMYLHLLHIPLYSVCPVGIDLLVVHGYQHRCYVLLHSVLVCIRCNAGKSTLCEWLPSVHGILYTVLYVCIYATHPMDATEHPYPTHSLSESVDMLVCSGCIISILMLIAPYPYAYIHV